MSTFRFISLGPKLSILQVPGSPSPSPPKWRTLLFPPGPAGSGPAQLPLPWPISCPPAAPGPSVGSGHMQVWTQDCRPMTQLLPRAQGTPGSAICANGPDGSEAGPGLPVQPELPTALPPPLHSPRAACPALFWAPGEHGPWAAEGSGSFSPRLQAGWKGSGGRASRGVPPKPPPYSPPWGPTAGAGPAANLLTEITAKSPEIFLLSAHPPPPPPSCL